MNRVRLAVLLFAILGGTATGARAQLLPGVFLSLEVHPGVGVPVGEFAGSDQGVAAGTGVGFGAGGALGVGPVAAYGAYQFMRFGCGDCGEVDLEDSAVDQGWEAGAELRVPVRALGFGTWVRAGVVGHQLELRGLGDRMVSDPALGWSAGGGVVIPFGRSLRVMPAVRFRSYQATFDFEELDLPDRGTDVSYLSLDVGLTYRF